MDGYDMFFHILKGVCRNNPDTDAIWSDGSMIYCESEELCNALVTIIDSVDKDYTTLVYGGYYDPIDERDGTGCWYVDIEDIK